MYTREDKKNYIFDNSSKIYNDYEELYDDMMLKKERKIVEVDSDGSSFHWGSKTFQDIHGYAVRQVAKKIDSIFMVSSADLYLIFYVIQLKLENRN